MYGICMYVCVCMCVCVLVFSICVYDDTRHLFTCHHHLFYDIQTTISKEETILQDILVVLKHSHVETLNMFKYSTTK